MIFKKFLFASLTLIGTTPTIVLAQTQNNPEQVIPVNTVYYVIVTLGIILLFQIFVITGLISLVRELQYRINHGVDMPLEETSVKEKKAPYFSRLFKSLTRSVPVGKQKDVMLDHNYDGIHELDNRMPPWLQLIFYASIASAVIYLLVYHVYDIGKLPKEEYAEELKIAADYKEERLKNAAVSVDEANVALLSDEASVAAGKSIFIGKCAACHGVNGEGNVGPNLTDDYWLHGGAISDIFKTVKYGIPSKGMVSWQGILKPEDMQRVASFIMTLHGTDPANAKAPQGELFTPSSVTNAEKKDSTAIVPDSVTMKSEKNAQASLMGKQ